MTEKKILRKGGPEECPGGACSECIGGPHHFNDAMLEDENTTDDPEHEAIGLGVEVWYQCKHCAGWLEYDLDADLCDDEPERESGPGVIDSATLPLFGGAW